MQERRFHPAANRMPIITGDAFEALVDDIAKRGLVKPIELFDGQILDGRNRYRACIRAGVEPRYIEAQLGDATPYDYVWSLNGARRDMDAGQKAAVRLLLLQDSQEWLREREEAKRKANEARAAAQKGVPKAEIVERPASHEAPRSPAKWQATIVAESAGVSRATVNRAQELQRKNPEAFAQVASGEVPLAKALREEKRQERVSKLVEISASNESLDGRLGRYPVIYADPPWQYDDNSTDPTRVIENQYPTMRLDDICALPVADVCTDDAILFLWATSPLLHKAFDVIRAWGFSYKTCAVWDKEVIGMGYFFRQQHELLLVAERGNIIKPTPDARPSSVYRERRGQHSAKPQGFYAIIERMYPELPKLELFCRAPRAGWKAWGNQAA